MFKLWTVNLFWLFEIHMIILLTPHFCARAIRENLLSVILLELIILVYLCLTKKSRLSWSCAGLLSMRSWLFCGTLGLVHNPSLSLNPTFTMTSKINTVLACKSSAFTELIWFSYKMTSPINLVKCTFPKQNTAQLFPMWSL